MEVKNNKVNKMTTKQKNEVNIERKEARQCLREIWNKREWFMDVYEIEEIAGNYDFDSKFTSNGTVTIFGKYGCYYTNLTYDKFKFDKC